MALCLVAAVFAFGVHLLGWPREQVLASGVLVATVLLWITEVLPLFTTAFVSIALQMLLVGNPGGWTWLGFQGGQGPTVREFLAAAVDPVLLLFFAGLVLARAATRTGLDRTLASLVLRPLSGSPSRLLLGVILVTSFFSLWMSNTATTALVLAIVVPVLRQVPDGHVFRKALVVAVPIAANVAGMSTPIASPPNAIAMSYLTRAGIELSFAQWMLVATPLVLVLLAGTWWWLMRLYPPPTVGWRIELPEAALTGRGLWVTVVAVVTFAAWLSEPWHGVPAPVVSVLPVALILSTTVLVREDVNSLDWDVLILIAGGLTLGYTLQVTGLDARLAGLVPFGTSEGVRLMWLACATLGLGTFFSNTAIASMFMPVAVAAAGVVPDGTAGANLTAFVLTTALVASLSMALPMSTPPNAMAYGTGEVTSRDFLRTGGCIGLAGAAVIVAVAALAR